MQCPVIVSMLIRTRMGSICLQIGILLVCSWSLWGVSFNPNDLNAQVFKIENSKFLQNPVLLMSNLYEGGFINTASHHSSPELLNLETCQLWQEGRKALPSKLMFYLWLNVMEWTLSTFKYIFFFPQEIHLSSLVWVCSSVVVVVSAVGLFTFSVSVQAFLVMPVRILHQRRLQAE